MEFQELIIKCCRFYVIEKTAPEDVILVSIQLFRMTGQTINDEVFITTASGNTIRYHLVCRVGYQVTLNNYQVGSVQKDYYYCFVIKWVFPLKSPGAHQYMSADILQVAFGWSVQNKIKVISEIMLKLQ